jgi:hypothetical protein
MSKTCLPAGNREIFENSDFIYMLNQAGATGRFSQSSWVFPLTSCPMSPTPEPGGLMFYGNTIIPFIDRFPKDTELYLLLTTKFNEVKMDKQEVCPAYE